MATPDPVYIFRMVHWQNIEYILSHGLCCKGHPRRDVSYINIRSQSLISARENYPIPPEGCFHSNRYRRHYS